MDFAKHGECVQREDFLKMMRMLKQWPDFFEKTHKPMRESVGILGKLYRDLSNEKSFREYTFIVCTFILEFHVERNLC